jgi:oxazoline/thiazoline synthase
LVLILSKVQVLDITSDFKIPSFAAISCSTQQVEKNIVLGFGTHFDPKIAITRAVTELNQTRLSYATYKGHFNHPEEEYWFNKATLENQPYLLPDLSMKAKKYTDYSFKPNNNLKEDVIRCIEIASNLGMETFVLDQTKLDIGLNVVKVIIPGLRHFWPRFAPGRLYEVPLEMGWLEKPLEEKELNPIPMFL